MAIWSSFGIYRRRILWWEFDRRQTSSLYASGSPPLEHRLLFGEHRTHRIPGIVGPSHPRHRTRLILKLALDSRFPLAISRFFISPIGERRSLSQSPNQFPGLVGERVGPRRPD